mgnify:CR=1
MTKNKKIDNIKFVWLDYFFATLLFFMTDFFRFGQTGQLAGDFEKSPASRSLFQSLTLLYEQTY